MTMNFPEVNFSLSDIRFSSEVATPCSNLSATGSESSAVALVYP